MSGSFQEARLGIDQIVRDINMSGYPSLGMFSKASFPASYAVSPFAWDPGYTNSPPTTCQVGLTCNPTPGDFDLIVETDIGKARGQLDSLPAHRHDSLPYSGPQNRRDRPGRSYFFGDGQ